MSSTNRQAICAFVGMLCLGLTGQAVSVAVVYSDQPANVPVAALLATGGFSSVTAIDARSGAPTLSQLSGYDAVLAYTNTVPGSAAALGNVLGEYYALGGKKLTVATYALSDPWSIGGSVMSGTDAGLLGSGSNTDVSGNLIAVDPTDPIFAGIDLASIAYFHNGNFALAALAPGATLLATDGSGVFMIARSASGVIDMNLFPSMNSGNNAEFYKLLAQTLRGDGQPGPGPVTAAEPASVGLLGAGVAAIAMLLRRRRANA